MNTLLDLIKHIVPEAIDNLKDRYLILESISHKEPVGRRLLSMETQISERILRSETEIMKETGLIKSSTKGMSITPKGQYMLNQLFPYMQKLRGLSELEQKLQEKLNLKKAVVVLGDSDKDEISKAQIGNAGAMLLQQLLNDSQTIALTGGTTIDNMVKSMSKVCKTYKDLLIVPARGSIGRKVELQANTIVVNLAHILKADYSLLNIPDNLSQSTINSIRKEPQVQKTLNKLLQTDIVVFGIGEAIKMARKREVSHEIIEMLREKGAVSEVFGYYFDQKGKMICSTPTIGIDIDNALRIENRIAIAGGSSKALAIYSACQVIKGSYLITDEGAAREILSFD